MRPSALFLALTIAVTTAPAAAQQPLPPSTRVRISAPTYGTVDGVGRVVASGPDTIVIRFEHTCWRPCMVGVDYPIPTAAITALEVSTGRRIATGIAVGTLTGALVGGAAGLLAGDDPPCRANTWFCWRFSAGKKAEALGVSVGLIGGAVGAAIGAHEQWEPVRGWSVRPRIGAAGGRGTLGLSLSF